MKLKHILLLLVLFGVAGYARERFFEHMNIIMASTYRHIDYYADAKMTVPDIMRPLQSWSYETLYYSKYAFTAAWVIVFFLISFFAVKKLTESVVILRILCIAYILLFLLAGISQLYGYLINERLNEGEYTLSRWLLGVAQSPLICLILVASSSLYNNSVSNKTDI
jgi:hypothetical protein